MSSITWTPRALASEASHAELALWRAVEAQHVVATRVLVDSLAEQELLEALLEAAKPAIPASCRALDDLLFTPFRYPSGRYGSRFRDRTDPGVWYGAETMRTACAEVGYWRCRFVADSDGLSALDAVAHTLFRASADGLLLDLDRAPLDVDAAQWRQPDDYGACRTLARAAREAGIQLIRYRSVRDPAAAACAAVLDCRAFAGSRGITSRQTWFLSADARRASWIRAGSRPARGEALEFDYA
ncbi:MAG: phosphoanhydride phosphorylase [Xanthomonadaceae bacterium]|nr:phosphoanhydride phosphorylase [Xanthomonadaceae bacterium]